MPGKKKEGLSLLYMLKGTFEGRVNQVLRAGVKIPKGAKANQKALP